MFNYQLYAMFLKLRPAGHKCVLACYTYYFIFEIYFVKEQNSHLQRQSWIDFSKIQN